MVADAPMGIPEQALTPSPTALLGPRVRLMGMPLSGFTMRSAVEHILSELSEGRGGWMITPNLDILRRYVQDPAFQAMANRANVCVADGMSLVWAAHLAGTPLPERVAGSSLIEPLCRAAADAGRRLYFLGGSPGTANQTVARLHERIPLLEVAGSCCPEWGFEENDEGLSRVQERLQAADPDIVFVALGSPKQERFIDRLSVLFPTVWWIGVGGSFDFLSGQVPRAPVWMQNVGLEWLYRLMREPRRLARRYLIHGAPFAVKLAVWSVMRRIRGR